MGKTSIEWTDFTFNPWWGCAKVSEACRSCYAEEWAGRFPKTKGLWGPNAPRKIASEKVWGDPIRWNRAAEKAGERHRVFCASMADVFEARDDLDEARSRVFALIRQTPALDWLLLTKRPEEIRKRTPPSWWLHGFPENVWVGTTVENQEMLEERGEHLLRVPARVRFVSCEPLLGPLELWAYFKGKRRDECLKILGEPAGLPGIDWVIAGGESGPNARPMHLDWARSLRDQCHEAGVPFHFKQHGEWLYERDSLTGKSLARDERVVNHVGGHGAHGEGAVVVKRVGKKAAGRLLDGRTHDEFPEVTRG